MRYAFRHRISQSLQTIMFALMLPSLLSAQTYKVLYAFPGGKGASHPISGLAIDKAGNLYGTSAWGGLGHGTFFSLERSSSGFTFDQIHSFTSSDGDGAFPTARPVIGPNGTLYGTTAGGGKNGRGIVYNFAPHCSSGSCTWTENIVYEFGPTPDGRNPQGGLVFDQSGNIYGGAPNGGANGVGVIYELAPANGAYSETLLYAFAGQADGSYPLDTLTFDTHGNLFGTTESGGLPTSGCQNFGCGTVFELEPSSTGWTETTLYMFQNSSDGSAPSAGLVFDGEGNLYGATAGGVGNDGTIFEVSPAEASWSFNLLYDIPGTSGLGPQDNLVRDSAGNLYGTTWADGRYGHGNIFKLSPTDGGWTYTSLHDFTGGSDGGNADGGLVMDTRGNLYGTTYDGGSPHCGGCGVIFEITP